MDGFNFPWASHGIITNWSEDAAKVFSKLDYFCHLVKDST